MGSEIEEIKQRLNIVDVLGEYLRVEKAGNNHRALCPFHNEKSPSFMISEEKQFWHCFGCQKSGDIFTFVMEMEGLEFRDALKILAEKAGVELKKQDWNPQKTEEKNRTLEILELATKFYEIQLWKGEGQKAILPYLRDRGLTDESIRNFRLGYAPRGWRNILSFLLSRGYKVEEIMKTGLLVQKTMNGQAGNKQGTIENANASSNENIGHWPVTADRCYDRFRDRIMFPVADYSGRVVGYSARVAPGGDETQAKYVNTPETEVYHKSRVLYGLDRAKAEIKKSDQVLLVEGNMDVIAASQAGMKNTVAVSGTALTPEQLDIIKRYTKKINLLFDMDSAGENATKKSAKLAFSKEFEVRVITLPSGKDAADLVREDAKRFLEVSARPREAMEYFLEKSLQKFDRKSASGKKNIAAEFLEIVANLENEIERDHWLTKLSETISVPRVALTNALKKANLNSRISEPKKNQEAPMGFEDFSSDKLLITTESLMGLALSAPELWKELSQKENILFLPKDGLLKLMLEQGERVGFLAESFLKEIAEAEKSRAERLLFKKNYQLGLNNVLEEIPFAQKEKEFKECLSGIKIESKKRELEKISGDLKFSEEKGDREAARFLRETFQRVSAELAELS